MGRDLACSGDRTNVAQRARGLLISTFTAVAVAIGIVGGTAWAKSPPIEGFGDLVTQVAPAVVNISTTKQVTGNEGQPDIPMPQFPPGSPFEEFFKDFFDKQKKQKEDQPKRAFALGSGFIVDATGFVVTNNHVVAEADEITVIMADSNEYKAELIGRDTKTDLALLKIKRDKAFPFVELADSDQMRVGDWMFAIGNPFGLGATVTAGIVSARGRDIRSGPYDDYIQVDAAINRGNSGGPSFNLDGKVFGINTAIFSPSGGSVGIGFAIPSNLAKPVIDSLKRTGKVARGWLGVRIQTVTPEIAESLGLDETTGALVAGVSPDGPAAAADIQAGDVILEFDGKKIGQMRSLPKVVAESQIGEQSKVLIWRKDQQKTVMVKLGELPDEEATVASLGNAPQAPVPTATATVDSLGITVAAITDELKARFQLSDTAKGVVVTDAGPDPSSPQEETLKAGDLIVEINQQPVGSPPEVMAAVNTAKESNKKSVLLLVDRQNDLRFIALRFKEG